MIDSSNTKHKAKAGSPRDDSQISNSTRDLAVLGWPGNVPLSALNPDAAIIGNLLINKDAEEDKSSDDADE